MRLTMALAAFAGLGLMASLSATAAEPTMMRVIVVQTADAPAYLHELAALKAIYNKLGGTYTLRVWRATYAGTDTGAVVVTIEYANIQAFAKLQGILHTNQEVAAEMKKLSGLRAVLSDSLYDELTEP